MYTHSSASLDKRLAPEAPNPLTKPMAHHTIDTNQCLLSEQEASNVKDPSQSFQAGKAAWYISMQAEASGWPPLWLHRTHQVPAEYTGVREASAGWL